MDLWIRTQDKQRLLKVNEIFIVDDEIHSNSQYCGLLGEYSSRERAIEVLDEIQNLIIRQNKVIFKNIDKMDIDFIDIFDKLKNTDAFCICGDNNPTIDFIQDVIVYEMPKE